MDEGPTIAPSENLHVCLNNQGCATSYMRLIMDYIFMRTIL